MCVGNYCGNTEPVWALNATPVLRIVSDFFPTQRKPSYVRRIVLRAGDSVLENAVYSAEDCSKLCFLDHPNNYFLRSKTL